MGIRPGWQPFDRLAASVWALGLAALALAGLALVGLGLAGLVSWPGAGLAGMTLTIVAGLLGGLVASRHARDRAEQVRIFRLVGDDAAACFSTDADGQLVLRNRAAEQRFGPDSRSMTEALLRHVVNPGALFVKLQTRAAAEGAAREDVTTRQGTLRLSVHRSGAARFLWRVEDFSTPGSLGPEMTSQERPLADAGGADLEDVPVALMTFGPDGVLRSANRAVRKALSRSPCAGSTKVAASAPWPS